MVKSFANGPFSSSSSSSLLFLLCASQLPCPTWSDKGGSAVPTMEEESGYSFLDGLLTLGRDYNRHVQPPGSPALVYIGFVVSDVMEVNDDHYTITIKVRRHVEDEKDLWKRTCFSKK